MQDEKNNFKKNKRGWIRIVEAFVAVLIITGLVLVIIGSSYTKEDDPSNEIYQIEEGILRDIQGNYTLRTGILSHPSPPVSWSIMNIYAPTQPVAQKIVFDKPAWLECRGRICALNDVCEDNNINVQKNVYARSVIISSNTTTYNPRQLKLFCWMK